jgi:1,2-dihydroxy-3-keto-5-methylthiopentene dioxygenase
LAYIQFQHDGSLLKEQGDILDFLTDQEVIYEHWDIKKLPENLVDKFLLSDSDKIDILSAFSTEIAAISERRGYKAHDVIALSEHTPNLQSLLVNFQREHHHTDDEVRFIVSGHGVFVILGKDGTFFEVHLEPGDLISVPPNVRHYFTLEEDRKVVAIRIFVTTDGWVPYYEKEKVDSASE